MHVLGHDDEFIQNNRLKVSRDFPPTSGNDFAFA